MLDFRLIKNRREALIRYSVWQYRTLDVDTPNPLIRYMFDRLEYNKEQRYYMCFLYGCTYQIASSYAIFNAIPDYENIDSDMIKKFTDDNYSILPYQQDLKWSKGYLNKQLDSYISVVGKYQYKFFEEICNSEDPKENYEKLRKIIIDEFYKFGRYACWFYMQSLKECCNLNIEPTSLQLGPTTQSPTDGLCVAIGKEEWMSRYYTEDGKKKNKRAIKYTPEMIAYLDQEADSIINEINTRFPDVKMDYFAFETILCSFKKLFRRRDSRYLGYYIDRLWSDTQKTAKGFPGVDWDIISDFIKEKTPFDEPELPSREKMNVFLDTGDLPELSMYEDLRNE